MELYTELRCITTISLHDLELIRGNIVAVMNMGTVP